MPNEKFVNSLQRDFRLVCAAPVTNSSRSLHRGVIGDRLCSRRRRKKVPLPF